MNNWISDTNRWALAEPPDWWLKKLWEFDSSLVVVPSRQTALYRLAQRRPLKLSEKLVNDALFKESDTQMLATYSLVPVTSIIPNPNWSDPAMFQELANRAPWRLGGAESVIKKLEASETAADLEKAAEQDDYLDRLGKDGWGLYNKKIGVRSHMWIPRTRRSIVGPRTHSIRVR